MKEWKRRHKKLLISHSGKLSIEEWMDQWQLNPTKIRKTWHKQQDALWFTLQCPERFGVTDSTCSEGKG